MRTTLVSVMFAVLLLLVGCGKPAAPPPSSTVAPVAPTAAPASDQKLGQQIFETGLGASGMHVAFTGGSDRFKAKPAGCVGCHGADGAGKTLGAVQTPNITYAKLRGGDKPDLPSDEAVLTLIRTGQEDGKTLSAAMPRWQLSDEEGRALLEHLKTLKPAATPATQAK